jgi:hypothetical protein
MKIRPHPFGSEIVRPTPAERTQSDQRKYTTFDAPGADQTVGSYNGTVAYSSNVEGADYGLLPRRQRSRSRVCALPVTSR